MEPNTRPVGVFDSGVGGISVLSELVKLMPYENFIYFSMRVYVPYGSALFSDKTDHAQSHSSGSEPSVLFPFQTQTADILYPGYL